MNNFNVFADQEKSGWSDSDIVDAYVERFAPITGEVAQELVNRFVKPGLAALDLCCGHGQLTAMLASAGAATTGLDFSPDMLERAKAIAPQAELKEGDAGDLPFPDNSFDLIVCNFGMMHLPDQPKALSEIRRVLRPGGRFAMATWHGPNASPAFSLIMSTIREHADLTNAPAQPDLFAFARPQTAAEMMAAAGLRLTSHDTVVPVWDMSSPIELFEIYEQGTVGVSMLIRSQQADIIARIRDTIAAKVASDYAEGSSFRVPVPVAVLSAEPVD